MASTLVQAQLKGLDSPDVPCLQQFQPNGPFGILVSALIGPNGSLGQESFDIIVCTPAWLDSHMTNDIMLGRHYLFVKEFDYERLMQFLINYCETCEGSSWQVVAKKVSRLGHWEFEDYKSKEI